MSQWHAFGNRKVYFKIQRILEEGWNLYRKESFKFQTRITEDLNNQKSAYIRKSFLWIFLKLLEMWRVRGTTHRQGGDWAELALRETWVETFVNWQEIRGFCKCQNMTLDSRRYAFKMKLWSLWLILTVFWPHRILRYGSAQASTHTVTEKSSL